MNTIASRKLYSFGIDDAAENPLSAGRYLVCPKCGEHLKQLDVEGFSCCPFCDHKFEQNTELEDFILEPVINTWIRQMGAVPSIEDEHPRIP